MKKLLPKIKHVAPLVVFLISMSSFGEKLYELPEAVLYVDGVSHKMKSGSSCWDGICSDSFGYVTAPKPIKIQANSELDIELRSNSQLEHVIFQKVSPQYLRQLPELTTESSVYWSIKPQFIETIGLLQEYFQKELDNSKKQELVMDIPRGQYILSFGTWWNHGDASFDVYIEKL